MELPTATWTVVQFVEDKSVEAVPTNWLDGDKCYWPPLRKVKLNQAIKKHETPHPTWVKFSVQTFRNGIFNDYAKARRKAKEAEETSDLQSEVDKTDDPKKRKIYRPSWASSSKDLSTDETMLPTPPRLGRKPKIVTAATDERPLQKGQAEEQPGSSSTIENQGTTEKLMQEIRDFYKATLEQQHLLRSLLTGLLEKFSIWDERFQERALSAPEQGSRSIFKESNIVFPINSEEELQKLEMYLQSDNNFTDAVAELATVRGANNYNFVKRVMGNLLTNRLGTEYSWLGRKGKKIFHTLKLAKIIPSSMGTSYVRPENVRCGLSVRSENVQSMSKCPSYVL